LTKGLVGFWLMNAGAGGTVWDLSGNGNAGTLIANTHFVPGKFGPALAFDGTGDYVTVGNIYDFSANISSWSCVIWVKALPRVKDNYLIGTDIVDGWYIRIEESDDATHPNKWLIKIDDGINDEVDRGNTVIADGKWHQLAVTLDAGVSFLGYADGQLDITLPTGSVGALADTLSIGSASGVDTHLGHIDHVAIWNRALSPLEIAELYRDPFAMFRINPGWAWYVPGGGPSGTGYIFNVGSTIFGGAVQ